MMDHLDVTKACVRECLLKFSATALSGAFFGAAWYVNVAENAARKEIAGGPSAALEHYLATFYHAMNHQKRLALLSGLSGVGGYFLSESRDCRLLVGGLGMLSLIPYTMVVIMPVNRALLDKESSRKKDDEWKKETLAKWNTVHAGRTIISGVAFLTFICAGLCK